jgi:DNA-directed RNA polymerase specialized sigma24 family protein
MDDPFERRFFHALNELQTPRKSASVKEFEQWLLQAIDTPTSWSQKRSEVLDYSYSEKITRALNQVEDQYLPGFEATQERWFHQSFMRALNEVAPSPGIPVMEFRTDVRRFVYKLFRGRLRAADVDPEEAIQEVLLGLLIRNQGICAWRPSGGRARPGYVFMVTESVVNNMCRKRRYDTHLQVYTLSPAHLPTGVSMYDDTMIQEDISEEDCHRYVIEQKAASPEVSPVLVEDLERACKPVPHAYTYVKHMVEGGLRQDLHGVIPRQAIVDARKTVRDFLDPKT